MSYCYDFIKKFKKEGNFCGLDKSQVSRLESYLEIVDMLMKQHLEEKFILDNFTLGAATPLIPIKDSRRSDGLSFVTERLKAGEPVTARDMQEKLQICNKKPHIKPEIISAPIIEEIEKTVPEPVPEAPIATSLKERYGGSAFTPASELIGYAAEDIPKGGIGTIELITTPLPDLAKQKREQMEYHATELLKLFSDPFKVMVADIMRDEPSYKVKDVFYFGVQKLAESKKKR